MVPALSCTSSSIAHDDELLLRIGITVLHAANVIKNSCAATLSSPASSVCNNSISSESVGISDLSLNLRRLEGASVGSAQKITGVIDLSARRA